MSPLKLDLFICDDCGLVSSDIRPDPSIYDRSYVIKYNRYEKTSVGEGLQRIRYGCVKKHLPSGQLLDFGCGVGSFIKHCNLNGIKGTGFDINPYGDYTDVNVLLQDYDVMTFWDSLEHIENPVALIKGIGAKYIFISTPSTEDYKGDLTQWHHYMPEEHCHYYNENNLKKLIELCGYTVIETNYDESELRKSGGKQNILTMGGVHGSH